jgi:hypothetical protein
MNPFVVCSKVTLSTAVATFGAFVVFSTLWTAAAFLDLRTVAVFGMLYLNELTTAFIGLAAGWYAARYRVRPFIIAPVAAALVEALHSSASGAFKADPVWQTSSTHVIAAALACLTAWVRLRIVRPSATEPVSI